MELANLQSRKNKMLPILLIAADSPEKLRPIDVDRVMMEALEQGMFAEFKQWILNHQLKLTTRKAIKQLTVEDFD